MKHFITCVLLVAAVSCSAAFEWRFADGETCQRVIPDEPALRFQGGFKATVQFACEREKIDARANHANLFCKGRDFLDGYCVMVRKDGWLLVDIKGIEPQYQLCPLDIQSGRLYTLEVYVTPKVVRLFLDGVETGSYPYMGTFTFGSNTDPLKLGSMGGYKFCGRLPLVRLEPLSDVVLPPGGPAPMRMVAPVHQARADIIWERTICEEKDRYIGWPTIARLANGELLAVFSGDREQHICPWGKVQFVRSSDDGETWTQPQTIANGPIDDRDAGIVQMPDGTIIVTYFTSLAYRDERLLKTNWPVENPKYGWRRHDEKISDEVRKDALGYFRVLSKDNGRTWSKPMKMTGLSHTPHGPILLKDGSLLQIGRSFTHARLGTTEQGHTIISVWKSRDLGASWQCLCQEIADTNGENAVPHMFHEPYAIELPDGKLVGLVRYHGKDNCLRQTVSEDGGKTWTPMTKTGMVGLPPHLVRLADGKLVCVYGRRVTQPIGFGEFAAISDDNGQTWDVANEIQLSASFNGDLGYPASTVLPNGDIVTVYYQCPKPGVRPVLKATKWRVKK
ncbi:MAG TPA: sialidase family protein [Kiritimatiellia bacterium]|nr:sialidase family protein [Kiritimatiellia bacterium]HPS08742.1 sialidase family protein [Kiritimatiellia bacterium]